MATTATTIVMAMKHVGHLLPIGVIKMLVNQDYQQEV